VSTALDDFVALKREVTYGTLITPDRAYPWVDGTEGDWLPQMRQGAGVMGGSGRTAMRGSRWFLASGRGVVTLKAELESRGGGVLLDLSSGVSTVNAIAGGSLQVMHTQVTNMVLPSATIQLAKVLNDGSRRIETWRGCTAMKTTIEQPFNAIPTIEVEFDALAYTTATAAIVPSYALTSNLFDAMHATVGYGGTITVPSASALATGLTAVGYWRSFKLEIDQNGNDDGWVLAGGIRSQPKVGVPTMKLTGDVEFSDNVLADAYVAGTKNPWQATWSHPTEVVGAVPAALQVAIPQIVITKGIPQVKPGEAPRTYPVEAEVKFDGTNRDVYLSYRTQDTAL
jgi:hypothetical protein